MWTLMDRVLVGDFGSGQALGDDRYRLLEPLIPPAEPSGRPRTTDMRRLLDGLFYVVRTGCQWRHPPPPPAFPPWPTAYGYFRAFLAAGVWESMRHHLVAMLREREGRDAGPTAAIIDTQSVETTERGPRGWDAAKRLKGRKRQRRGGHARAVAGRGRARGRHQDADGFWEPAEAREAALPLAPGGVRRQHPQPAHGDAGLLPVRLGVDHPPPRR
ncbi:hypothetical protein GCM10009416_06830 [Craurococcus roseus]|uniref:Insertion element IS402-like domain-containing protein n=1 Tax=Craurococcus roseus TaxID=77585 RepID=A0ABP3PMT8_9PROT